MNKLLIFFSVLFVSNTVFCQNLLIGFNSTGAGRNITATYSKEFGNNEFGLGLGVNINRITQVDDQFKVYYKRLYATEFTHYLNFNVFYQIYIFRNLKNIKPFVFYDLQIKYSTTRNRFFLPYAMDTTNVSNNPEENILYKEYIEFFGPFTWVENTIGIGFKVNISDKWYLQQKLGFGTYFILGYDDQLFNKMFNWFEWEFAGLFQVGIGYSFGRKTKE